MRLLRRLNWKGCPRPAGGFYYTCVLRCPIPRGLGRSFQTETHLRTFFMSGKQGDCMNKEEYLQKLKDPRWQKKRLEILERDGWQCRFCGEKETTLHVHHICYLPRRDPWDIPNGFLITFCEGCHNPESCPNAPCEECGDYNSGDKYECNGPGNPGNELIDIIGDFLNTLLSKKNKHDFLSIFKGLSNI